MPQPRTPAFFAALCVAALSLATVAVSQNPVLVRDLRTDAPPVRSSRPEGLTSVAGQVLFRADSDPLGTELYVSDGTPAGTRLVLDINPGRSSSHPDSFIEFQGAAWFAATTATHGRELWRTDFTTAGTTLVKDLVPGPGSASPNHMLVVGNTLYLLLGGPEEPEKSFPLYPARHRGAFSQLWKSDGTAAGTVLVKSLSTAGPAWARNKTPVRRWMAALGNMLLFTGLDHRGTELWRSDGTAQGTFLLKDIAPGPAGSEPREMTVVGNRVLFVADDGAQGAELWSTDGTNIGTYLVKDLTPGPIGSAPTRLFPWKNRLYFAAPPNAGEHLWVSDGTAAGTTPLLPISPADHTRPRDFVEFQGRLFFSCVDRFRQGLIVATDGVAVQPMIWPALGYDGQPRSLRVMGGDLYFSANAAVIYPRLFRFAGAGVPPITLDGPPANRMGPMIPDEIAAARRHIVCVAQQRHGVEPWGSDGTAAGTLELADLAINPTGATASAIGAYPSWPLQPVDLGDRVAVNSSQAAPPDWWDSDGTAQGTRRITPPILGPQRATWYRGAAYEVKETAQFGAELWRTDTTGSRIVLDIWPGPEGSNPGRLSSRHPHFIEGGGVLYFSADNGTNGRQLWRTDGSAVGTTLLTNLGGSGVRSGVAVGDELLFTTSLPPALYRTDGTRAGTRLVADLSQVPAYPSSDLVRHGAHVFFTASGAFGLEPWVSDGTTPGTRLLRDIAPGAIRTGPLTYTRVGPYVVFFADDGVRGGELWRSDGTTAGTVLVRDIWPGARGSDPSGFVEHSGLVYFSAHGPDGNELWRTDGTAAGTMEVADIEPFGSSDPWMLTPVGSRFLWFSAWTHQHGRELWRSDGTAAGTQRISDILPGDGDGVLGLNIVAFADKIAFAGVDPLLGSELHAVVGPHAIARTFGRGCGAGAVPELWGGDPVMGRPLQLALSGAPPSAAGVLVVSPPWPRMHLGEDCTLLVDAGATAVLVPLRTDGAGQWRPPAVSVPNVPALRGAIVTAQAGVDSPRTPPMGVALTSGLQLVLDPR